MMEPRSSQMQKTKMCDFHKDGEWGSLGGSLRSEFGCRCGSPSGENKQQLTSNRCVTFTRTGPSIASASICANCDSRARGLRRDPAPLQLFSAFRGTHSLVPVSLSRPSLFQDLRHVCSFIVYVNP